jgi:NAD(P)-dependent dehydrogenase (short-subunit alcohol dehydrogenase family)
MRPTALVTGARRGIGAEIAIDLAKLGFDVAITDLDGNGAEPTLAAIGQAGRRALFVKSDLADVHGHASVVNQVAVWGGPIACLVNNAGIPVPQRGDLLDVPPAAFDRVLDVNLRGTFFFTQAVANHMLATTCEHPRSIITISSSSAELVSTDRGEYCVSKAGLAMAVKLFAVRLAPHGIGVFDIRPGVIRTPMTEIVAQKYEARIADGLVPMNRWGYPSDVARAVSGLATGQFAFATGSVINVDGGLTLPRL